MLRAHYEIPSFVVPSPEGRSALQEQIAVVGRHAEFYAADLTVSSAPCIRIERYLWQNGPVADTAGTRLGLHYAIFWRV